MDKEQILREARSYIRQRLEGEGSGHDWWHIYRVRASALEIGQEEHADPYIVELGALMHDVADWKFHAGDTTVGPYVAREKLTAWGADEATIVSIADIIETISFKGAGVVTQMKTIEGKVVQDADRLDALGAIGIARCFAYGGHANRPIYDPNVHPVAHKDFAAYQASQGTSLNHFYEKLFLLAGRMNTKAGRKRAEARTEFMRTYVTQFMVEWDGAK